MPKTILFYRPQDPHGHFSNFSRHSIIIDDVTWPTTEHFFQAQKSLDPEIQEHIRKLDSPGKAKNFAHTIQLRLDWEEIPEGTTPAFHELFRDEWGIAVERVKDHFMFSALIVKFNQHEDLKKALIETGDALLIEDTFSDPYWGNGPSKNGLNKLGRQLMLVRKRLLTEGS